VGQMVLSTPAYEYPEQVTVKLIVHLKKCMFFQHLNTAELIKLIQRMKTVEYEAGDEIIK
jgi:hypothetical protein